MFRRAEAAVRSRSAQSVHAPGARDELQRLLRVAQVALFVEEGPDMLRQFREEFDCDRVLIRTTHRVGCRDFGRFGVHHFLSLYKVDYQSRLWLRASVECAAGTFLCSFVALTEHQWRDLSASQLITRNSALSLYCRYPMLLCGKYFIKRFKLFSMRQVRYYPRRKPPYNASS